jgi:ketosteroid isomerase-like protein
MLDDDLDVAAAPLAAPPLTRGMGAKMTARKAIRIVATAGGILCMAGTAAAQKAAPGDSAAVAAAVHAFHSALARGDSTASLALLAPGATILESGSVETVSEYRTHHLPSDIDFARAVPATRGPVRVTVRGDAAWAASTSETKGEFRGRPVNSAGAELMVLTRTANGWRISAIHWSSRRRTP